MLRSLEKLLDWFSFPDTLPLPSLSLVWIWFVKTVKRMNRDKQMWSEITAYINLTRLTLICHPEFTHLLGLTGSFDTWLLVEWIILFIICESMPIVAPNLIKVHLIVIPIVWMLDVLNHKSKNTHSFRTISRA